MRWWYDILQRSRKDEKSTNHSGGNKMLRGNSEIISISHANYTIVILNQHRMPYKPANCFWDSRSMSVYTRIPIFVCFAGRLVNTPHVACHHGDWRVYTPSFLGVPGVMVGWPRTNSTASNERVHSFCGFLPNPFIHDLCLWCTSQEFVKTDLHPLSWGLCSLSVRPGAGR